MSARFKNLHLHESHGLKDVLRWKLSTRGRAVDLFVPPVWRGGRQEGRFTATWIGHSSFLFRAGESSFLVDPVLSDYCAPFPAKRLRRRAPPGLALPDLLDVPTVFITHNHYDHLDRPTIRQLPASVQFVVPKGLGRWFRALGRSRVEEFDWWGSRSVGALEVTCVPAQHFSSRTLWDRDRTLWAGWIVQSGGKTIYLAGDTGYCPVLQEIGERFGPVDLATLPIGAYEPRWFMKPMHVNPEEAVQIHREVRSRLSIACHWGTFCLTDEPMDEPPRRLAAALQAAGNDPREFRVLSIGESVSF